MEMITRWVDPVRGANINTRPTTGQIILNRWKSHGYRIQRIQYRPAPADNAIAPPVVVPAAPPAHAGPLSMTTPITTINIAGAVPVSPLQTPLAELSPRFANSNDPTNEKPLSPTYGQLRFLEEQLSAPWKFASVPFKFEPASKSVYTYVLPNLDKVIEEVRLSDILAGTH